MMVGFREPSDAEWDAGIVELEKVIGAPEAARQSWRRRLVIMGDGSWRLLISECGFLSGNDYGLLGFTPGAADAFPIAMPIAAAVALLKSKDSPEIELQRRRNRLAELAERHRKQEEDERNQQLAASKRQLDAQERAAAFRHNEWMVLQPWQQALFALALRVKERDPELADDLRKVASSSTGIHGERSTPLPAPSAQWWA
jgi:hypothetical protein